MKSPIYREYNARIVEPVNTHSALVNLFNSYEWKTTEDRRNKLCKACLQKGDHTQIKKKIEIDDRKLGMMILDTFRLLEIASMNVANGRIINLNAHNKEFIDTPEKEGAYVRYQQHLNIAMFLADAIYSALVDARTELKKIDPNIVLNEFKQLTPIISAIADLNSYTRKDMSEELQSFYGEKLDELNEVVFEAAKDMIEEYNERKELEEKQ